jgi:hypothetical protein
MAEKKKKFHWKSSSPVERKKIPFFSWASSSFFYVKWKRWRRTTSRPRNTEEFFLDNEGKKNGHGDDVCVARAQDQRVCRVDLQNESSRKEKKRKWKKGFDEIF